jgi:Golgi nucleoside diphosphatase
MKWLRKIMATLSELKNKEKKEQQTFTKEELEFLLQLIADSTFEGKDVQLVYETAVKIQKNIVNL